MNKTIPIHLREEFKHWMKEHDFDDLSDGAWLTVLNEAAGIFITQHKLKDIDSNDATHQYLAGVSH